MSEYAFRDRTLTLRERIEDLLKQLTVEEKIHMLSSHQLPVERLGIGEWHVGCEVARGLVSREEGLVSTVFPQPIGMASAFDKELMRRIGEIAGDEARYYYSQDPTGKLMLWGPTVDMERNPLWGRTEEGYGEDTCLAGELTKEYTIGMAGSSRSDEPEDRDISDCRTDEEGVLLKTVPTLKHFCANNNEEGRGSCNANVTEKLLHEYYYRAFMPALKEGGAHSAMAAYNKIGGVPGDMNPDVQRVLKDKWGMDFTVTDGGAFTQNVLAHRYVKTHAEALAMCIKNGVDVMTDSEETVAAAARAALDEGLITEKDIDKAVGSSLLGRFRLGEFDGEHKYSKPATEPDSEYGRSVNLRASLEQICLLKNNGMLPLDKENTGKMLICGPIGDENYKDWYTGTASYAVSVKSAFEKALGADSVLFDNGWDIVAVRSVKNGKYMSVSDSGAIEFTADDIGERERFELYDWDGNTYNFRSLWNGKYVTEKSSYEAASDIPYSWFIREWFKPHRRGKYFYFETWHDDSVYLDKNGALKTRPACRASDDRLFEIVTVSRGTDRIKALSEQSDKILFCGGNHPMQVARECYDRHTLDLPPHQHELVMGIPSEKLIFAVISSYSYAIPEEAEHSSAVMYSSHCGAELGNAVVKTIFGENNPAARCPVTWYSSDSDIPPITEYNIIRSKSTYMYFDGEPLYPFGHGLSYSSFKYSDFEVSQNEDSIAVGVTVKNTSDRDGDEVVQIYFRRKGSECIIKLCGFERVNIPSGESRRITLAIPNERISEYDPAAGEMKIITGDYTFMAAASSKDIRCSADVNISGEDYCEYLAGQEIFCKNYMSADNAELDFSVSLNDRYAVFGDWGGSAKYGSCRVAGCKSVSVWASAPTSPAEAEILLGDKPVGSARIAPSVSRDDFSEIVIPIDVSEEVSELTVRTRGSVSIYKMSFNK